MVWRWSTGSRPTAIVPVRPAELLDRVGAVPPFRLPVLRHALHRALAERLGERLVTADTALLRRTALLDFVVGIED
jgi:hypothetical protein